MSFVNFSQFNLGFREFRDYLMCRFVNLVVIFSSYVKRSVTLSHTPLRNFFKKEFSAGCQPRYPVKIPITTWKSLSPPRGLQLYPSCQARCPVKTSNEMENYPAPSAAQLLTMLLHREHFCSYFYYTQSIKKINTVQ